MKTPEEATPAVPLIFPGFRFGVNDPTEAERLVDLGVGGFCLYAGEVRQVAEFTARLQKRARRPLLFCADYEDGLPSHCAGGTALPSNMGIGAAGLEEPAFRKGAITAREARAIGVDWVLAPVADLATEPANPIVNVRSFSPDPKEVARLGSAYLRGLRAEGALSCLKHFPGHGPTTLDSHLALPRVDLTRAAIEARDMVPFVLLAAHADAVMTGHLDVPALTGSKDLPYSLSEDVSRTLRGRLGFEGVIATDALHMGAVSSRFSDMDAARRALLGGSDLLLVPGNPAVLARDLSSALENEPELARAAAQARARLERMRAAAGRGRPRPELAEVGGERHSREAEKMAESCLAWSERETKPLPRNVSYLEPDAEEPSRWRGKVFVDGLRREGVNVKPYKGGGKIETLVMGSFAGPRAWTGRIGYDKAARTRLSRIMSRAREAVIVSFGSPYVFSELGGRGLCAFSNRAPAQRAAALALTRRIPVTGRMPATPS